MRTIIGTVANTHEGFHVAAAHLNPVMHLIEGRMGLIDLVPGTLNVCIPENYIVTACAVITPDEYGFDETVKLQRCLVEGHKAVIMRPDTHERIPGYGHGKNHLELMGRVNFREVLGLYDGKPVRVEVEGDDAWWNSGF
jgi:CTP-dependent riboflavin kinase